MKINQTRSAALIATLGSEPQVVSAALDLLLRQGVRVVKVAVLHTDERRQPIASAVARLRQGFAGEAYEGQIPLHLEALVDESVEPLADVETPAAVQAAFRSLYRLIRREKLAGRQVHLSIAGGRKTMALHGMAAAQLLFDDDDCMWHLYSGGDFLESKRMHPLEGDDARLIAVPVVLWSAVSPVLLDLGRYDDPYEALERQKTLRLRDRLEKERGFVLGSLTPAEERAAALLVREGLSDQEIAGRLSLSSRTVEQQLRSVYRKAANYWELEGVRRTQLMALLSLYYTVSGDSPEAA